MTLRERILAVYAGETPDVVPFMLDLSHWFYHKRHLPWDLSRSYENPDEELVAYHRGAGVGFYIPNLGSPFAVAHADDVSSEAVRREVDGVPEITWRYRTPVGEIERTRVWEEQTYAWGIKRWGVNSERDLRVLGYAMGSRRFAPRWDKYEAWKQAVGDGGVVYMVVGYSAMGYIMNYWMGVEQTIYAAADWPGTLHEVVDRINGNLLDLVDLAAASPAEVVLLGDNFSSDIQPPSFFAEWSRPFYEEAARRLHRAGKRVIVHIDGRLRGAIQMICDTGADGGDAITPKPMGDLTPAECRAEAGPGFILSGGVSPDLWLPGTPVERFKKAILDWFELKAAGPRLIAAAGDQVPPGAEEDRIFLMRDLVEKHGRY